MQKIRKKKVGTIKNRQEIEKISPDYIKSEIKLSIGILVSNNIGTIRKCLESLTPLRQAVKSELIVVDTKGEETDGSIAIAKEYADKVYSFAWCNDFAAARNVCIDHAKGEWFLFVDDDEWFEDTTDIIEFFQSGECDNYGQGLYHIRNYYDTENHYVEAIVGRFVHRTPQTRFVGKVHERLNQVYAPDKLFQSFAYHSGYVYNTEEEKKRHQERNLSLLKEQIKEEGYTPHLCAQMIQEFFVLEDTMEEGYHFIMQCIPILVEQQGKMMDSYVQWILVASVRYFNILFDNENFWKQDEYIRKNYSLGQMADLFLAAMEVSVASQEQKLEVCEASVQRFIRAWDWLKQYPKKALEQNQLDFGKFYNEGTYFHILHIGAMCANQQKKYELANQYWKRFPWNREGFDKAIYWSDMQETVQGLKNLQKQKLDPQLQKLIEQLKQNIQVLIQAGDIAAAKELLQGLEEIVPWDEEIAVWKQQIL